MTKRTENLKIKKKVAEFDEAMKPIDYFFGRVKKEARAYIKMIENFLMYHKKPSNKLDKFLHNFAWWLTIAGIFFAFKGFTYTVFGR